MDIKLFREDDGTFWAKITLENEVIFWQWDTMEALREDMRWWLECAFDTHQSHYITKVQQPLEPMLQFFITHTRSHAAHI